MGDEQNEFNIDGVSARYNKEGDLTIGTESGETLVDIESTHIAAFFAWLMANNPRLAS